MKLFDYVVFIIIFLNKRSVGGVQEGLYGYPYLEHPIQLLTGYWVKQMSKINIAVGKKNHIGISGGKKQFSRPIIMQEVWKYIEFILSEFTHGKKGKNICGGTQIVAGKQVQTFKTHLAKTLPSL